MPASPERLPPCNILPLFMGLNVRNVTFLLDTSEGMCSVLGLVKGLLIHTLVAKASLRNSLFNLLSFSHKVIKWRDHMVTCVPDLVCEAQAWIQALSCSPSRDLLGGLVAAFADSSCQAVLLVTNGLPDKPQELLQALPRMTAVQPVHVFYLSDGTGPDWQTQEFLRCFARTTGGSCHILTFSAAGDVEAVKPLLLTESWTVSPFSCDVKYCSAKPGPDRLPTCMSHLSLSHLPCRGTLSLPACPISLSNEQRVYGRCRLAPGARVLARRDVDGFYYLGTLKEEVQGIRGVFWIEFDKPVWTGALWDTSVQPTSVANILPHTEAHRHSLLPGDKVLAPWGPELTQYRPGSVRFGTEFRDPLGARNTNGLQVLFWNGHEADVPGETAVWVSPCLYEKIVRELRWPHWVLCCHGNTAPHYTLHPGLCCIPLGHPCSCSHQQWWPLPLTPHHVVGSRGEKEVEELERKVDLQLKELKECESAPDPLPSSHSSADEDETLGRTSVNQAVNTDLSLLRKPRSVPLERPTWKYWRRSHPEPQHKLPSARMWKLSRSENITSLDHPCWSHRARSPFPATVGFKTLCI
ncbi:hypothetical protein GN956_G19910 [Arapaima gigas]